jgi:Ca2+-binding RTX toxin-like protein
MGLITGTSNSETLQGTDAEDDIRTRDGDDIVYALGGNDFVNSTESTSYYPITGSLVVYGGDGDDKISGSSGNDTLYGDAGNDELSGREGNDTLEGSVGNDVLSGDDGDDAVDGGDGDDTLYGGEGNDTLEGGVGDDVLWGNDGDDKLYGRDGDDAIRTGNGLNVVLGGAGNDNINGNLTGTDTWSRFLYTGGLQADGGEGNDFIFGSSSDDSLIGGAGNDFLVGDTGNDNLKGGDGDDTLHGGDGDDTLDGGAGYNELQGGDGNDTYILSTTNFYIFDSGGNDSAIVNTDFVKIPSSIENVSFAAGVKALPYWIDAVLADDAARYPTLLGSSKVVQYGYPQAIPSYETSTESANGYLPFNAAQKDFSVLALNYIASILNITFSETSNYDSVNTITFANNIQSGSAGYARYPSSNPAGNDVYLNSETDGIASDNLTPSDESYSALTLIHELGHALGLKHPFSAPDSTGSSASSPYLPTTEDITKWTQMSYQSDPEQYQLIFSPIDIAALHYVYGPNPNARSGDDIYVFDENITNFIWDGGGTDTISASTSESAVTIYLEAGMWGAQRRQCG